MWFQVSQHADALAGLSACKEVAVLQHSLVPYEVQAVLVQVQCRSEHRGNSCVYVSM